MICRTILLDKSGNDGRTPGTAVVPRDDQNPGDDGGIGVSNLRSDCRDLVKDRPAGDVWRTHVERLCYQIDEVEERWHAAERKLKAARELLENIVCTEGEDRGLVLVDHESRTRYDEQSKCHVYLNENFSPLGDALIQLWDAIQRD